MVTAVGTVERGALFFSFFFSYVHLLLLYITTLVMIVFIFCQDGRPLSFSAYIQRVFLFSREFFFFRIYREFFFFRESFSFFVYTESFSFFERVFLFSFSAYIQRESEREREVLNICREGERYYIYRERERDDWHPLSLSLCIYTHTERERYYIYRERERYL